MDIIRKIIRRPRKLMAVGALFAFPGMGFLAQCAPQTCADKPGSQECTPPYVQGHPSGSGANAYAGTQYLREAGQPLIRVVLVCEGDWWWTPYAWSNADNISGNIISAYGSCYPRRATAMSYETSHS